MYVFKHLEYMSIVYMYMYGNMYITQILISGHACAPMNNYFMHMHMYDHKYLSAILCLTQRVGCPGWDFPYL